MSTDDGEQGKVIPAWRLSIERFARTLKGIGLRDLDLGSAAIYMSAIFGVLILWIVGMGVWALRKLERGERIVA